MLILTSVGTVFLSIGFISLCVIGVVVLLALIGLAIERKTLSSYFALLLYITFWIIVLVFQFSIITIFINIIGALILATSSKKKVKKEA